MNDLLFDFRVDKSTHTVFVTKTFEAEQGLVWDAFTKQELLDQWWAPKPWTSKTQSMDFTEGGRRFYAMVSPEGNESWQIQDYLVIHPKTHVKYLSVFADKDQNPHLPGSIWDLHFSEENGMTTVNISIYNESLERMEQMIAMGFQEGFTMTLTELTTLLTHFKQS